MQRLCVTSSGILLELPPFVFCFLLLVCLVEEVELSLAGSMVKIYYISQVWIIVYVSVCGILIDLACLYIKVNSCVYLQEANHAASITFSVTPFQNQRHWILQYRHTKSGNCSVSLCKFILQIKAKSSWMIRIDLH